MRFDDNAACALLFGQHHLNLARIEQKLPVSIVTRGNEVFIQGQDDTDVRTAAAVLEDLRSSSTTAACSYIGVVLALDEVA